MDFLTVAPTDTPKRSYQCLAAVSIGAGAGRRGSQGSDHGEELGITRILSGGRRRSVQTGNAGAAATGGTTAEGEGTWYWRCRAGVTADNLVIMPISTPPNPLLKQRPPPLSNIVHGNNSNSNANHNRKSSGGQHTFTASQLGSTHYNHPQSAGEKITGFGRRLSAAFINPGGSNKGHNTNTNQGNTAMNDQHQPTPANDTGESNFPGTGGGFGAGPSQANQGQGRLSGEDMSNATATADTTNVPAETGWPGMVDGQPLHGIIIPLHYLKKDQVKMGGKDREGCHVSINIGSAIAGKSGHIRFEFDKDMLGGKAEAELLKHNIEMGCANASPLFGNVQLGKYAAVHQPVVPDKYTKVDWKDDMRGRW